MDADFAPPDLDRRPLTALAQRSDRAGLLRLAGHAATLVATGALVLLAAGQPLLLLPAMALHGAVLIFLFAPLHETIHRTAFRSRSLNDAVAFLCGLVLLLPPDYFRAFHFAHHRYTQDPARDPELARGRPATRVAFLWHLTGVPFWAYQARLLLQHARGRVEAPYLTAAMAPRVIREARLVLAIYAGFTGVSLAFGPPLLPMLWVGPALLGQPWLRAFLAAEHMLCPLVPEMAANTRTTLASGLVHYFGWNMSFHAEHHLVPAIPFFALPKAHALLRPRLLVVAAGYPAVVRQIWAATGRVSGETATARGNG